MSLTRILALSSSRAGNAAYLETAEPLIKEFLGIKPMNIAFIPFASVDNNYAAYASKVREGLKSLPYTINVVEPGNAKNIIKQSDAVMTGGGNTFKLLHDIYQLELLEVIKAKVYEGTPYIGWSAGANITGLTIGTTNDMPVIEPRSFKAFGFFPFQINPHYLNVKPTGHNGETRDERLAEFIKINPRISIIGLPEGTALMLKEGVLTFIGNTPGVIFNESETAGEPVKKEISIGADLSYLLQKDE